MSGTRTVRVRIRGRVQGVFFRAWTETEARALGLSGWVRNRRDGSVEAVFTGPREAVETMIARCREGPPLAEVSDVAVNDEEAAPPAGFHVRPTV